MFEHRNQPLLPMRAFLKRMLRHAGMAFGLLGASLLMGVAGYHIFENLPWIDSFLNASMILGGMGPVNEIHTEAGKLFASFYALYSGLVLLVFAGIIFTPVFHRLLHHFHLETEDDA